MPTFFDPRIAPIVRLCAMCAAEWGEEEGRAFATDGGSPLSGREAAPQDDLTDATKEADSEAPALG